MTSKQKKWKRIFRGQGIRLEGDPQYEYAKSWGKNIAGRLLVDNYHTKDPKYLDRLDKSIEAMKKYGYDNSLKTTRRGFELTPEKRKLFRVASRHAEKTKQEYKKTGLLPATLGILGRDFKYRDK